MTDKNINSEEFTKPMIEVKVQVNTVRDGNGKYIQGSPQMFSTPSKDFIAHILDKKIEIPTVDCNRKGDGCPTPITELQIHNSHVPNFNDENEMVKYCHRILSAVKMECSFMGVMVRLNKDTKGDGVAIVSTETLIAKCTDCGAAEKDAVGTSFVEIGNNQEGYSLCATCYTEYKKQGGDNDLPW